MVIKIDCCWDILSTRQLCNVIVCSIGQTAEQSSSAASQGSLTQRDGSIQLTSLY